MTHSQLGIWLTAQVTFTELIEATTGLDAASRRYGMNAVMFGAAVALADLGFAGICLFGLCLFIPRPFLPTVAIFLLFFAAVRLAYQSRAQQKSEQTSRSISFSSAPKTSSLPVIKDGFTCGFWSLASGAAASFAVWLAITLAFGWRSATLGAALGIIGILYLMLQTKQIGLSKNIRSSAFSSFAAGVVMGYAAYFFKFAGFSH